MRKNGNSATKVLLATMILTAAMGFTAYAGEWKQDNAGWKYEQDGGGFTAGWSWIDGKCYFFADDGYMMNNTEVEGYTLNADGQWTVDGIVQTDNNNVDDGLYTDYVKTDALDALNKSEDELDAIYGKDFPYKGEFSDRSREKLLAVYAPIDEILKTDDLDEIFNYYKDKGWNVRKLTGDRRFSNAEYWIRAPYDMEDRYELVIGNNEVGLTKAFMSYTHFEEL